ncbi:MAG TPA: T9SS type A sorting domain-containing protein [Chitinophagales bacterium]|nr:T9SS type A sorting domain-containing protein [Chitinophagales bacterium]
MATANTRDQTLDSIKIFTPDGANYYLGVYGFWMEGLPCFLVDSSAEVVGDSINVRFCYLATSSGAEICRLSDSIYLGRLTGSSNYTITFYATVSYMLQDPCDFPEHFDTVQFSYVITGLNDISEDGPGYLYPNPTNGRIFFPFKVNVSAVTVRVISIDGRQMFTGQLPINSSPSVDLSSLSSGFYFVEVQSEYYNRTWKVMKE